MDKISVLAKQICDLSKRFYDKGWCVATSGNFSARLDGQKILITVTGKDKGRLSESDVIVIPAEKGSAPTNASAEAQLHRQIYLARPDANAVLHLHSPFATIISMLGKEVIILEDYEMLKAIHGVTTHEHRETVPVFPNSQNITEVASAAKKYLAEHPSTDAFLLSGHGLYTWGEDLEEAARHVEALEFLFECEYRRQILK